MIDIFYIFRSSILFCSSFFERSWVFVVRCSTTLHCMHGITSHRNMVHGTCASILSLLLCPQI